MTPDLWAVWQTKDSFKAVRPGGRGPKDGTLCCYAATMEGAKRLCRTFQEDVASGARPGGKLKPSERVGTGKEKPSRARLVPIKGFTSFR